MTYHHGQNLAKDDDLINITDANESPIGRIERFQPWSKRVAAILQIGVVRKVKIRRGRTFTQGDLAKVCNRSDPRGSRILACMIQAGGEVMQKSCESCWKTPGPFEDCIIHNAFPKCGNCEWTRHGCHGASTFSDELVNGELDEERVYDTDSYTASPGNNAEWEVYQVKTRLFTSAASLEQCLRWAEEQQCFTHLVLIQSKPEKIWGALPGRIGFTIELKEISEVKWNAKALRVQFTLNQDDTTISKCDGQPRGEVMVTFDSERTVCRFVQFCKELNLKLIYEEQPPEMVRAWMKMTSETTFPE